jgi:colanic acid biosynthesis glycosyl transferase WcaI
MQRGSGRSVSLPDAPCGRCDKALTSKDKSGRRRIFIYGMNYAPEVSGVGRYTAELAQYLSRQGDAVEVVTTAPHYPGWTVRAPYRASGYYREMRDGVRILRCPVWLHRRMQGLRRALAPLSFALTSAIPALWRIARTRPAVILVIEPTLFVAPVALLGAWMTGARAILHVQDLEVDAAFAVRHLSGQMLRRLAVAVEAWLLRRFDLVVTISTQMRHRLLAKRLQESRVEIVRNWIDLKKIRPLTGPNSYRAEMGLRDDHFVVLYAGNIGVKQALPLALESAAGLAGEERILFVIAGDGPEKPGLIARYGDLPNVRFLPLQPEERLCELLNLADLHLLPQDHNAAGFVLPSKLGGILASGRPLLAMADAGTELHDFLQGAAILVPAGDSRAVGAEIARLAQAPGQEPRQNAALLAQLDCDHNLAHFAALIWRHVCPPAGKIGRQSPRAVDLLGG